MDTNHEKYIFPQEASLLSSAYAPVLVHLLFLILMTLTNIQAHLNPLPLPTHTQQKNLFSVSSGNFHAISQNRGTLRLMETVKVELHNHHLCV